MIFSYLYYTIIFQGIKIKDRVLVKVDIGQKDENVLHDTAFVEIFKIIRPMLCMNINTEIKSDSHNGRKVSHYFITIH